MTNLAEPVSARALSIQGLMEGMRGEVIGPADRGYDDARGLYVTGFDFRPAAIVRVADAADVARAVRFAAAEGLELAVRSGGHSLAGHSGTNGGLVVDLTAMRTMDVDASGRTAWADAGTTAGVYTRAVGEHGLATGFGDAPTVGIGGITLGGGVGFLHRAYGLTIDSVLAAEVVTADGEIVRTDAGSHPDLFWAIRGGGGNFGVVTRFRYRLHAVDNVLGGMMILPGTPTVLDGLLAELVAAEDDLSAMVAVMIAPPIPGFPPEIHGKPVIMALLVHCGDPAAGERALAPIRALATPIVDAIHPMPYARIYDAEGGPPHPVAMAGRTMFLDNFDLAAAEAVFDGLRRSTAGMSVVQFRPLGGAVARVPDDATAFPHRNRQFISLVGAMYERSEEREAHEAWAEGLAGRLRGEDGAAYIGFLSDVDSKGVREAYGPAAWDRLRAVKRRYDPTNLFRRNHNVPPANG